MGGVTSPRSGETWEQALLCQGVGKVEPCRRSVLGDKTQPAPVMRPSCLCSPEEMWSESGVSSSCYFSNIGVVWNFPSHLLSVTRSA
jgi:hypothetical protein